MTHPEIDGQTKIQKDTEETLKVKFKRELHSNVITNSNINLLCGH
jgi:hypothetical protein